MRCWREVLHFEVHPDPTPCSGPSRIPPPQAASTQHPMSRRPLPALLCLPSGSLDTASLIQKEGAAEGPPRARGSLLCIMALCCFELKIE